MSDSPPERDVEWTAAGAEAAYKFLARVWRIADEIGDAPDAKEATGAEATALLKATHRAIRDTTADIEGFAFNKAVARLHELANALQKCGRDDTAGMPFARRQAFEALAQLMAPMTPHFAEEIWQALGQAAPLVETPWPTFDAGLIRDDTILMPVQINGRKRTEIEVDSGADRETVEGLVMASPDVARFLGGQVPRKVIVVPGRIVNVVI
jgi:leucyl-tRNA synthetase